MKSKCIASAMRCWSNSVTRLIECTNLWSVKSSLLLYVSVDLHIDILQDWLDIDRVPPKAALAVIQPAKVLVWHPVSTLVNNSRNKDPQCNKPITLKYVHSCVYVLQVFRFLWWFLQVVMSGGVVHVVRVCPEVSSCPVALLNSCNDVFWNSCCCCFCSVLLHLLLLPRSSVCTIHSDDLAL